MYLSSIAHRKYLNVLMFVFLLDQASIAVGQSSTFSISVSLPSPSMRIGEQIVIDTITSNLTDHDVYAGNGRGVGPGIELLDSNGKDVGLCAMGTSIDKLDKEPAVVLISNRVPLEPGKVLKFTLRFRPTSNCLIPGTYQLRVHRRDMVTRTDVYSNTAVFVVVP